jgi:hypothetical protein
VVAAQWSGTGKVEANRSPQRLAHPANQSPPLERLRSAHAFCRRHVAFGLRIFWRIRSEKGNSRDLLHGVLFVGGLPLSQPLRLTVLVILGACEDECFLYRPVDSNLLGTDEPAF